jgi:hypothetical protein
MYRLPPAGSATAASSHDDAHASVRRSAWSFAPVPSPRRIQRDHRQRGIEPGRRRPVEHPGQVTVNEATDRVRDITPVARSALNNRRVLPGV